MLRALMGDGASLVEREVLSSSESLRTKSRMTPIASWEGDVTNYDHTLLWYDGITGMYYVEPLCDSGGIIVLPHYIGLHLKCCTPKGPPAFTYIPRSISYRGYTTGWRTCTSRRVQHMGPIMWPRNRLSLQHRPGHIALKVWDRISSGINSYDLQSSKHRDYGHIKTPYSVENSAP